MNCIIFFQKLYKLNKFFCENFIDCIDFFYKVLATLYYWFFKYNHNNNHNLDLQLKLETQLCAAKKKFSDNFRKSLGAFLKAEFKHGPASIQSALTTIIAVLKPIPDDSINDLSTATGNTAALDSEPGILFFCIMLYNSCRIIN